MYLLFTNFNLFIIKMQSFVGSVFVVQTLEQSAVALSLVEAVKEGKINKEGMVLLTLKDGNYWNRVKFYTQKEKGHKDNRRIIVFC